MHDANPAAPAWTTPEPPVAGIRVRGVTKRFGAVAALDGVDLDVGEGEVVVLLGPNGAGKTTLLRILSTLVLPDRGTASVDGWDIATDPQQVRRSIGLVLPDDRSWAWRLTGRHNLEFFGALHGMGRRDAAAVTADLLHTFGLDEAADRRFGDYSAGTRSRLSLARALLGNPTVLLLDEPTRSLDPVAAANFHDLLIKLKAERGVAVLLVTHDLHEATSVADRILMIARGRVREAGRRGIDTVELERQLLEATRA